MTSICLRGNLFLQKMILNSKCKCCRTPMNGDTSGWLWVPWDDSTRPRVQLGAPNIHLIHKIKRFLQADRDQTPGTWDVWSHTGVYIRQDRGPREVNGWGNIPIYNHCRKETKSPDRIPCIWACSPFTNGITDQVCFNWMEPKLTNGIGAQTGLWSVISPTGFVCFHLYQSMYMVVCFYFSFCVHNLS